MSTEAKNPNGPTPLRPVPLCHRLLAAPASVDRSCVGSACSMWALVETGAQAGPSGFCSEVRAAGGYTPPWLDPAQDAPEPVGMKEPEPEDSDCKTLFWANDGAYGWVLRDKSGAIYYSGGLPDQLERRSCKDGYEVPPWPGGVPAGPSPEPVLETVPPVERLRYDGKTVEWRAGRGSLNLYPEGSDGLEFVAAVNNDGSWHVFPKITGWANCGYGTADPPSENAAKTAALRTLIAEGVLAVEPEPVPAPVGTWGGHTDWIAWVGGPRPVAANATVRVVYGSGVVADLQYAGALGWAWRAGGAGGDIIAYRIVQPEPASKPAPDADLGPVPSPCWRRDSQGPVDDQAPQEKPKGLVRALGQSELRLAAALRELEATRIALAEAEAELERLGSTRAVSYEYQIKWES